MATAANMACYNYGAVKIIAVFALCAVLFSLFLVLKGTDQMETSRESNHSFVSDVSFIEAKFCLVEPAICSILDGLAGCQTVT